ncbi:acyltransferase [Parahaliea aestuarii]|uniref:Acyltransferase n=2 Tax=Parahaliea aestuarii TaxID=1852021 RepID=A0A5C8ZSD9_9GAMM|nr:acyltransferase [Parahaliea aestuarii]
MRLMFWIYRYIGAWAFTLVLQPVVLFYFLFHGEARRASREYLQQLHCFSGGSTPAPGPLASYRHLLAFSRSTVDKLGVWARPDLLQSVHFPKRHLLQAQLDSGRGAVLLGAHLGNLEICRSLSRGNPGLKLNILVHTRHADRFNHLLRDLALDAELELVEVSELSPATALRLSACVERGEFLVILADRVPVNSRGRCQRLPFLGRPAPFPEGPFILAGLLKCPVYTVFCTRTESGYDIDCQRLAERVHLPRKQRSEALRKYMASYVSTLENKARSAPLQWFNFYRFWDQSP